MVTIRTNNPQASIKFSAVFLYILIRYNVSAVFRHSTTALYAIYNIQSGEYFDVAKKTHIQLAQWAPVGHGLVYVYLNNIYYLPEAREEPKQITSDGVPGTIYNGVPDWVYEEEVLSGGSALWFSPNGKQLLFASFNDTGVPEFDYFKYGEPGSLQDQYPTLVKIKYPKVGTPNPVVTTHIAQLEGDVSITEISAIPSRFRPDNHVLCKTDWITNDQVAAISTNRVQNEGELIICTTSGICKTQAHYKEEKGWLELTMPKFNKDGTSRIEVLSQPEGDDYFDHIVLTEVSTNSTKRITSGRYFVTLIYGWDEENNKIYFQGSRENHFSQEHVYVVNLNTYNTKCLSCDFKTYFGLCKSADASFSTDLSNYALICKGPGPYYVEIRSSIENNQLLLWEDNNNLVERLTMKAMPVEKNLQVPVADGFTANVRLLLPPNLDETSKKKYPTIVNVYGGPNSNQIRDSYSIGFQNYIVTNRQYIYIYIDGRGSGRDGWNKIFQIYRRMGTVEIEDQINVTKYLQEHLPYIDETRTGIWGWSYGGFAAAWTLLQDRNNIFKCGLSVAPVTNFIYYDSIYTERYMGLATEEDNLRGYNKTDLSRNVEGLRGKQFFLIHGNADDNVHYQQSMLLAKALERADILFRQQSYPDENHSLQHVSSHLYHTIDQFWTKNLGIVNRQIHKDNP